MMWIKPMQLIYALENIASGKWSVSDAEDFLGEKDIENHK